MEINWTVLTYLVIGLFALSGFFRGWWKEAITTIFLAFLVTLLQIPDVAQVFIDLINLIFATVMRLLPDSLNIILEDVLETTLGIRTVDGTIQVDASDGGTWLTILLLFIGAAILISRFSMPNWDKQKMPYNKYSVTWTGSVLGGLVGGLNGLLIISLITKYLDGYNLPGGGEPVTEIAMIGSRTADTVSPSASLQAVQVPTFTILDSFLPWIFVAIGLVVFLSAIKNRVGILKDKEGFRKVEYKAPVGYEKIEITVKDG
jgi:hypothetical protein